MELWHLFSCKHSVGLNHVTVTDILIYIFQSASMIAGMMSGGGGGGGGGGGNACRLYKLAIVV